MEEEMKFQLIDYSKQQLLNAPNENEPLLSLPEACEVTILEENFETGFAKVKTILDGEEIQGFLPLEELAPASDINAPTHSGLCGVNRPNPKKWRIRVTQTWSRTYPLNDPQMPRRIKGDPSNTRVKELGRIINYLKVNSSNSERYVPTKKYTYCNIYAYDYAYLANAWLPRVWWTEKAIKEILSGKKVVPRYTLNPKTDTLRELRANGLFKWFNDYGVECNWRKVDNYDELQDAAQNGEVGVIVAATKDPDESGHITLVVPETATHKAKRNRAGKVTAPLQSQAGRTNRKYFDSNWEKGTQFRGYSYWVHP